MTRLSPSMMQLVRSDVANAGLMLGYEDKLKSHGNTSNIT